MIMKKIIVIFLLISINSFSQSINGLVIDGDYNEPMAFANVIIKGTTKGTTTDIDGKFSIDVDPGVYTLQFSFIGYDTKEITDINVILGNEDNYIEVTLMPSSNELETVVITTTAKRNSESSILSIQRNSVNLVDGLSIQAIKKIGDSDLAGAIKRVPGISVQGGKYVYVRGLGDRYSKTTLNGMELPGLDPDRNTIPMDIFPSNLIDNLIVKKSASAEVGADFTGGTVDIALTDFTFSPTYSINYSSGYNPDMHFNNNFLADKKSSTDWLGKDDGYRSLPIDPNLDLPPALPLPLVSAGEAAVLTNATSQLNKVMKPIQTTSDMNHSFGLSASNGYKLKDQESSIGYIAALGYKSQTSLFENFYQSRVFKTPEGIEKDQEQFNVIGKINTYVSSLFGLSFKNNNTKIVFNFLNLQNGESNASNLSRQEFVENPYHGEGSILTYTERNLQSIPVYGKHTSSDGSFKVNWKIAKSSSSLNDKDFKRTIFETDATRSFFQIQPNTIAAPSRLWRDLNEESLIGKLDFEIDLNYFKNISGKIKFGGSSITKDRDFSSKRFDITYLGNSRDLEGDPNAILADENIWVQSENLFQSTTGSFISGGFERTNRYQSESVNNAYYLSSEIKFSDFIKTVLGIRYEDYELLYTGENATGDRFDEESFIDTEDFFPSLNLIVSPNENSNIRVSYYKTTARPTFKEASTAYLIDPITETFFLGNPDIKPSYIDNFDLRYELYGDKNQMFALSVFLKEFKDPIEIVAWNLNSPNTFTARNNQNATVKGAEMEFRKNIFDYDNFRLSINSNASYIVAKQTMDEEEYNSRVLVADEGQTIDRDRELQGQSPFMINFGLSANQPLIGLNGAISYNVQGKTLQSVGVGGIPDVYSEPFNNLDLSISKTFNSEIVKKKVSLRLRNILKDKRESFYIWNDEVKGTFRSFNPGITISLGVSLEF